MNTKRAILTWSFVAFAVLFLTANALAGDSGNFTPRQQLELNLDQVPFSVSEYRKDTFDCSNMAALIVEELDAKGYNAEIVVVRVKQSYLDRWNIEGKRGYHVFVIVDRQVIIEPTFKVITFAEGEYGDFNTLDWYIETWDIIGVYADSSDAIKRSRWSFMEWNTGILR